MIVFIDISDFISICVRQKENDNETEIVYLKRLISYLMQKITREMGDDDFCRCQGQFSYEGLNGMLECQLLVKFLLISQPKYQ